MRTNQKPFFKLKQGRRTAKAFQTRIHLLFLYLAIGAIRQRCSISHFDQVCAARIIAASTDEKAHKAAAVRQRFLNAKCPYLVVKSRTGFGTADALFHA
jgi:hypothetical protein